MKTDRFDDYSYSYRVKFNLHTQEWIRIVKYLPENRLVCVDNVLWGDVWDHPEDVLRNKTPRNLFPATLQDAQACLAEATMEEIVAAGWDKYLLYGEMAITEQMQELLDRMGNILLSFGFVPTTINDRLHYACGGCFCRLTPMCENRTILLEAAESRAWVEANGYEDGAWYDLPGTDPMSDKEKDKLLEHFRGDIVLYFTEDNFDEYLRSGAYQKSIRNGSVVYSQNGTDVLVYFEEDSAAWKIRIQKQSEQYERLLSPVMPDKTAQEMKDFVKQHQ